MRVCHASILLSHKQAHTPMQSFIICSHSVHTGSTMLQQTQSPSRDAGLRGPKVWYSQASAHRAEKKHPHTITHPRHSRSLIGWCMTVLQGVTTHHILRSFFFLFFSHPPAGYYRLARASEGLGNNRAAAHEYATAFRIMDANDMRGVLNEGLV